MVTVAVRAFTEVLAATVTETFALPEPDAGVIDTQAAELAAVQEQLVPEAVKASVVVPPAAGTLLDWGNIEILHVKIESEKMLPAARTPGHAQLAPNPKKYPNHFQGQPNGICSFQP